MPLQPMTPDSDADLPDGSGMVRSFAHAGRKSAWAFTDQGVASFGNFAINLLLARYAAVRVIPLADVGSFWLLFEWMLFINGVQAALVLYPMTLRGAAARERGIGRLTSMSLVATLLGSPLAAVLIVVASLINGGATLRPGVMWLAAAAVITWQLQETTRRALMSELRFRAAVVGDTISYVGQAFGVWWVAHTNRLSLEAVYLVMTLTSLMALAVQCLQIGLQPFSRKELKVASHDAWRLGRWQLSGNVAALGSSALYTCNIRYWVGLNLLAVHGAINNLFRVANPLTAATSTLIVPNSARANARQGLRAAVMSMLRFASFGAVPLVLFLGCLFVFPSASLNLAYGRGSPYHGYEHLVRIISLNIGLIFVATATGSLLNAVGRSHKSFVGQLGYAGGFLLVGMPLTMFFQLTGAALGGLAGASAQALLNIGAVLALLRHPENANQDGRARPVPAGVINTPMGPMSLATDTAEPAGAQ